MVPELEGTVDYVLFATLVNKKYSMSFLRSFLGIEPSEKKRVEFYNLNTDVPAEEHVLWHGNFLENCKLSFWNVLFKNGDFENRPPDDFHDMDNLKSIIFVNPSAERAKYVINHENASRVERISYVSTENMIHGIISGDELESILCHPIAELKSLSLHIPSIDEGHIRAIRKAHETHSGIKHLKIKCESFETHQLASIFSGGYFSGLETLVIEQVSGEMTIEHVDSLLHLPLKVLFIRGCNVKIGTLEYIAEKKWFQSLTRLALHIKGEEEEKLDEKYGALIPSMLGDSIEEFDMDVLWRRANHSVFFEGLGKMLSEKKLSKLTRLTLPYVSLNSIQSLYNEVRPECSLTIRTDRGRPPSNGFSKLVANDNVYIYGQMGKTGPNGREPYQSMIHEEFAEERGMSLRVPVYKAAREMTREQERVIDIGAGIYVGLQLAFLLANLLR